MPDDDGPGSNIWDFLQTVVTHPAFLKIVFVFLLAAGILAAIAVGVLDGDQLVGWFRDIWHTIKGTA